MKSISLYRDNGTWLCRVHPFTKLMYIAAAIIVPLLLGTLWAYAVAIALDIALLISGKSLKRARALIIFSFTIIATIFIIKGLFDADNLTPLFSIGSVVFYREGMLVRFYTGVDDSKTVIENAHKLRNANPLSHASSQLLDSNDTSKDLCKSIKALSKLIYGYIDKHKEL